MVLTLSGDPAAAERAGGSVLHTDPLVYVIDDFLSAEACAALMALGGAGMQRATVAGLEEDVRHDSRTNSVHYIRDGDSAEADRLRNRVTALAGLPPIHAEPLQLIHYAPGTEYKAHYDSFDPFTALGRRYWTAGGQRLMTGLAYLNEVGGGGATAFPLLDLEVAPRPGRLLMFQLCHDDTVLPHDNAFHAGCPVTEGEKWAVNIWMRQAPFTDYVPAPDTVDIP
ncbi:hypothetical protein CCR85_10135 [Rhodothalassium salexigens]|uniref:prolyl hydroxylase family protein n=1 Tax=Rhodothalassium salexigens TaxID=1086 RepID=UPI001912BE74|nr:2OG-Fe(II) oxygenase [Rhodothalassium salexigens]MBK5911846.1 hypothetical protein [Rhodothalassium salexigens]MBK5922056.1 hypothetical protein [Rhodothalassium salexigens]